MVYGENPYGDPLKILMRREKEDSKPPVGNRIKDKDRKGNVIKADFGRKKTGEDYEITPVPGEGTEETVVRRRKREEISANIAPEETIGDPLNG